MKHDLRKFRIFIALVITAAMLYLVFKNFNSSNIIATIKETNKATIFFATIVLLGIVETMSVLRMRLGLKILDCNISLKDTIKIHMATLPASKLSPANVGEVARSFFLRKHIPISASTGGLVFERMLDIVVLSLFSIIASIILLNKITLIISGCVLFTFLLSIFLLGRENFLTHFIKKFKITSKFTTIFEELSLNYKRKIYIFIKMTAYTIVLWSGVFLYIKTITSAAGGFVGLLPTTAIQPVVAFSSMLPMTISGVGTREVVMAYLYGMHTQSIEPIIVSGLVYSFFGAVILPLMGLPLAIIMTRKSKQF